MDIYDIENIVHGYDNNIIIDMNIYQDKIYCTATYQHIKYDFNIAMEELHELTRLITNISIYIAENILRFFKNNAGYLRIKKINRLMY